MKFITESTAEAFLEKLEGRRLKDVLTLHYLMSPGPPCDYHCLDFDFHAPTSFDLNKMCLAKLKSMAAEDLMCGAPADVWRPILKMRLITRYLLKFKLPKDCWLGVVILEEKK